jgi:hypothetical protein
MKNTTKHLYLVAILTLLTANLYFQYEQTELLEDIRRNTYSISSAIPSEYYQEKLLQKLDSIHTGINEVQREIPSDSTEGEIRDLLKGLVRSLDIILDR